MMSDKRKRWAKNAYNRGRVCGESSEHLGEAHENVGISLDEVSEILDDGVDITFRRFALLPFVQAAFNPGPEVFVVARQPATEDMVVVMKIVWGHFVRRW